VDDHGQSLESFTYSSARAQGADSDVPRQAERLMRPLETRLRMRSLVARAGASRTPSFPSRLKRKCSDA
jgi:hypothetical protein